MSFPVEDVNQQLRSDAFATIMHLPIIAACFLSYAVTTVPVKAMASLLTVPLRIYSNLNHSESSQKSLTDYQVSIHNTAENFGNRLGQVIFLPALILVTLPATIAATVAYCTGVALQYIEGNTIKTTWGNRLLEYLDTEKSSEFFSDIATDLGVLFDPDHEYVRPVKPRNPESRVYGEEPWGYKPQLSEQSCASSDEYVSSTAFDFCEFFDEDFEDKQVVKPSGFELTKDVANFVGAKPDVDKQRVASAEPTIIAWKPSPGGSFSDSDSVTCRGRFLRASLDSSVIKPS